MNLEVIKKQNGNRTTLEMKGAINTNIVYVLNDAIDGLDFEDLDLTLDFSNLSYITSVGLRTMLVLRKKLSEDRIRIIDMSEVVYDVFKMSGFVDFFPIESAKTGYLLPEDP